MAVLIIFFTLVLIGCAIQWIFRNRKLYEFAENVPGPKAYPVIGSSYKFFGKNEEERFKVLSDMHTLYSNIFKLWLGPRLWIFVNEPELIQKILLSPVCLEKSFFYDFLRLENGLISSKFHIWKDHRKFLNYSFNLKVLQSFMSTFIAGTTKMVEKLTCHLNRGEFNILEHTTKCTLDMICGTSFGLDITNVELSDEVFKAVEELIKIISNRSLQPMMYSEIAYRMTRMYYREKKARKVCYFYSDQILRERRSMIEEANKNSNDPADHVERASTSSDEITEITEESFETPSRKIFIDQLICHDNKFSDIEIRDHVYTVIAAGFETTALQSAHIILLLAMHPEVQEKVYQEIIQVFPTLDTDIEYENLNMLTYMERVIKETMRLCPAVPVIGRQTMEEVDIGEHKVPAGMTLLISFYNLHRRKDIWGPNADKFNPDNFSPENMAKRHLYSFLPFSGGTRNCIGHRYAMISLKVIITQLVRNFKYSTKLKYENIKFKSDITLKMCSNHQVSIEKRS